MHEERARDPFVGRSRELAQIDAAAVATADRSHAIVLTGDPGVGKSRLLGAASRQVEASAAIVLRGSCVDVGDSWPYYPVRQALSGSTTPNGAIQAAVHRLLAVFDDEGADRSEGLVLAQLHKGLTSLAAERAFVLVLDDLQWVDTSTRRLLLTLLSGLSRARVLLLGAVRAEDLQGNAPIVGLLRELQRAGSATLLEVEPLDEAATATLAAAVAGAALPAPVMETVWRRTGGNPLAVEHLVRSGVEAGVVPETLRVGLLSRVEALPGPARELARTLSVAAGPLSHEVLLRVWGDSEAALVSAVRTGVHARLVIADGDGYRLRHQLLGEALERELLPAERALLHRRLAAAVAQSQGAERHIQLAYHWRLAGEPERALHAVVAAAEDAERLRATHEAWQRWREAVELSTGTKDDSRSADVMLRAAEAAHVAGDDHAALELLDRLERLQPASGQESAAVSGPAMALRKARYLAASGRLRAAQREYESLLADPQHDAVFRADAAAHSADLLVRLGDYAAAGERARQAAAAVAETGRAGLIDVLAQSALGWSQAYLGDATGACDTLRGALRVAEASGSSRAIGAAYLHLSELLVGPANELVEGVDTARRGAARLAEVGGDSGHAIALLATAANGLFRLGKWAEAAATTSQALAADPTGVAAVELLLARARTIMALGDLDGAARDLRVAETLSADQAGTRQAVPLATLRAGLALWRQDPAAAREAVRRGWPTDSDPCDPGLLAPLVWHGLRAEAEAHSTGLAPNDVAVRRLATAFEVLEQDAASVSPAIRDMVAAYCSLCRAEMSRISGRSDPRAWKDAADLWSTMSHPYPAAYALFRLAEALLGERTRNREATNALRSACDIAVRLSAAPLRDHIESLARRARIRLERPAVPKRRAAPELGLTGSHPLCSLTEREREVLGLVAGGHSNREIGGRLFISERTVGVHVSRILAKLHARTRVEAAAMYYRAGTAPEHREGGSGGQRATQREGRPAW